MFLSSSRGENWWRNGVITRHPGPSSRLTVTTRAAVAGTAFSGSMVGWVGLDGRLWSQTCLPLTLGLAVGKLPALCVSGARRPLCLSPCLSACVPTLPPPSSLSLSCASCSSPPPSSPPLRSCRPTTSVRAPFPAPDCWPRLLAPLWRGTSRNLRPLRRGVGALLAASAAAAGPRALAQLHRGLSPSAGGPWGTARPRPPAAPA